MAQLPPRAPTMAPHDISWSDFQSSTAEPTMTPEPNEFGNPAWVDDFVEFSSAKRKAHRRSISDSIPFAEEPMAAGFQAMPESHARDKGNGEFEGFEDEAQLIMSIFNNELKDVSAGPADSSNRASSSGHGSSNPEKRCREERPVKSEHEEVESSACKNENDQPSGLHPEPDGTVAAPTPPTNENIVDPKRVKRILANRQSAQRSRVRKLQYISELERSLTRLQAEVSMLSPRVAFLDRQRMILNVDNNALKAKIAALTQDKIFKDAHQEAMKREIERLKQVYHQQSVVRAENATTKTPSSSPPPAGVAPQPH